MICLGIESTAHTLGIGIMNSKGEVLANERSMYKAEEGKGIIPIDAAVHHKKMAPIIYKKALETAKLTEKDIDLIAVAIGPGIPPTLWEGINFAKSLNKPLVGVNHCIAHIEIGKLFGKMKEPLTVYVSGGNTQLTAFSEGKYRVFGETLDIGIGNAVDKFARKIGLEMPGGPKVEKLAEGGKYHSLPYTIKGMDLAFSGLVTAAAKKDISKKDACYSFQETAFAMTCEVAERALAHTEKKEVLLTGGVAQNKRLQKMMKQMASEHNATFYAPPGLLCGDNGAMIAWTGLIAKNKKEQIEAKPRWRTDLVNW